MKGRHAFLALLTLAYTLNFIDRSIINVLAQSIKEDLRISDSQLGLLSGIAFAIFYTSLGIPIARLAERHSRVKIISAALVVWSSMTAVCGMAGSFAQLFLARVGVGVGEAGCSPAALSLISDYYPPRQRATAMAVYSLGIPMGFLFGAVLGGWIAHTFDWRTAFVVVGLPGVLLGVIILFVMKEPVRGGFDPVAATKTHPSLADVFRRIGARPAILHAGFATALVGFASFGVSSFFVPFLMRGFNLNVAQAGTGYGLVMGISAAAGLLLGGVVSDWAGKRDARFYALVPALGLLISAPLLIGAIFQQDLTLMVLLAGPACLLSYMHTGPTLGMIQNMVLPTMRASVTAIQFLFINLLGLGLGPVVVGWASDRFATSAFAGDGAYAIACPGGLAPVGATIDAAALCQTASFTGVKHAMAAVVLVYLWAGLHYVLAARTLKRDMEAVG